MKNKERVAKGLELVKCKDCHYYMPAHKGCEFTGNEVAADGFCSEGAKKLDPRIIQRLHDMTSRPWKYHLGSQRVYFLGTDRIIHGVIDIPRLDFLDDEAGDYKELTKEIRDIIGSRIAHIPDMLDLFCDVLSDCKLSDGMRSAITQILRDCKWRGY